MKKTIWLHEDEALREKAFREQGAESDIVRAAVRAYLGIED